jgi:putative ABC transport system permease protein
MRNPVRGEPGGGPPEAGGRVTPIRLYRLALLLLPPGFRREYGEALLEEAAASMTGVRGGRRAAVALRLLGDLAATVAREWWDVTIQGIRNGLGGGGMTDLRWALRGLRRSPGFALAVVVMLGLGVGASTAAVGLADAYLLESLPYPHGDRLVTLWPSENWSNQMMDLARKGLHSVRGIAGRDGELLVLAEGGEPEEVFAGEVTTNLFDVVGVHPVLGRGFVPEDGVPGAPPVTVLSHKVWVERFGSDPGILGRSVALGGWGALRRTVVGVMPADYLPLEGSAVAVWVPATIDPTAHSYKDSYYMTAVARLAPGATPAEADREIKAWAPRMAEGDPGWFTPDRVRRASVVSLARWRAGDSRTPVLMAVAAALLVLLVACANIANLVLARTLGRERELSVRAALGAGRLRTARVVGVEIATLATLGTLAGFALAASLVRALKTRFPWVIPDWGLTLDARWIVLAVGVALLSVTAAGLVPAVQAARRDPARAMAGGRGSVGHHRLTRLQELLSAVQLALAAAGVAAMGLLGRSLQRLDRVDPGVDPAHAITFRVTAPPTGYPKDADVVRFFQEARRALTGVPGVEVAGFGSRLPLSGGDSQITVTPEGMQFAEGATHPVAWHRLITPGYLAALGAHLVAGHIPTPDEDRTGQPELVVVNQAAAKAYWPGQSAIGKHFYYEHHRVWVTVAGVVDDVMEKGQAGPVLPALYIPHRDWAWRSMYAVVRTKGDPSLLMPQLERGIHSVSAEAPVSRVETLARVLDAGLRPTRSLAILATLAGVVTLLLGALGTYGVVSHGVARRLRELGVRAALGADRGRLVRGELSRATRIVAVGLAGGLALAWVTGRSIEGVLFGVAPFDPLSVAGALASLALVGYAAAYLPARRAARIDPVRVMREE